jgi:hypothetical protein
VVEDWTRMIGVVELRMELETERRERRRLERLFTGSEDEDEGDDENDGGGDSSFGGNGGQYSFSDEVSDRHLLQILEEAERGRRSPHYSPSMSIPPSHERFSTPTAPSSEYQPSTNMPSTPPATPPEYATEAANAQALEATILSLQRQFEAASRNLNQPSKHESVRARLANIPIVKKQQVQKHPSEEESDGRQAGIVFETEMMNRLGETEQQRDELQTQLKDNNRDGGETAMRIEAKERLTKRFTNLSQTSGEQEIKQEDTNSDMSFPDIRSRTSLSPTRSEALRQEFQNEPGDIYHQLRRDRDITTLEHHISHLSTEVSSLRLQLETAETRLIDLEVEHTTASAELNGTIAACREEISQLRARISLQTAESLARESEIEEVAARLAVLESEQLEIRRVVIMKGKWVIADLNQTLKR